MSTQANLFAMYLCIFLVDAIVLSIVFIIICGLLKKEPIKVIEELADDFRFAFATILYGLIYILIHPMILLENVGTLLIPTCGDSWNFNSVLKNGDTLESCVYNKHVRRKEHLLNLSVEVREKDEHETNPGVGA